MICSESLTTILDLRADPSELEYVPKHELLLLFRIEPDNQTAKGLTSCLANVSLLQFSPELVIARAFVNVKERILNIPRPENGLKASTIQIRMKTCDSDWSIFSLKMWSRYSIRAFFYLDTFFCITKKEEDFLDHVVFLIWQLETESSASVDNK